MNLTNAAQVDIQDQSLRGLRGIKQSPPLTNYLEMLLALIHHERDPFLKTCLILLSPLSFKAYRVGEAERIAWINGLPERVLVSLNDDELLIFFRMRYLPHGNRLGEEGLALAEFARKKLAKWNWSWAVRIERQRRRHEIQVRWDVRKLAHATPITTAPARAVRL